MAKKKTKALVVKKENLPVDMAKQLEAVAGEGFEHADVDSFAIPFLRILQSTSPQIDDTEECHIEGAKPGLFFNSVTGQLYGSSVKLVPVAYYRQFIEWMPKRGGFVNAHADSAILDQTSRNEDPEDNADYLENGNTISDTRMHYVLLADHLEDGPIILALSSTGIRHSKKWMTNMRMLRLPSNAEAPMFSSVYELKTVKNENDQGKWYQIGDKSVTAVERLCWVNPDQFQAAQEAKTLIDSGRTNADFQSTVDVDAGEEPETEF